MALVAVREDELDGERRERKDAHLVLDKPDGGKVAPAGRDWLNWGGPRGERRRTDPSFLRTVYLPSLNRSEGLTCRYPPLL